MKLIEARNPIEAYLHTPRLVSTDDHIRRWRRYGNEHTVAFTTDRQFQWLSGENMVTMKKQWGARYSVLVSGESTIGMSRYGDRTPFVDESLEARLNQDMESFSKFARGKKFRVTPSNQLKNLLGVVGVSGIFSPHTSCDRLKVTLALCQYMVNTQAPICLVFKRGRLGLNFIVGEE